MEPVEAEALGQLAGHLTTLAMDVLPAPRYSVTASWFGDTATINVLAHRQHPSTEPDPGAHPGISRLADSWGSRRLKTGPCVFAKARLSLG